jgi:hypothetical protein
MPIPPRYQCTRCEDWGTVVASNGKGTVPCPGIDPRTPCTAPKTSNTASTQHR